MSTSEQTHQNNPSEGPEEGITPAELFSASNIKVTEPRKRKNADGDTVFTAWLLHNGQPLHLETPWLRTPFGASMFEKDGKRRYSLALNPSGPNMGDEEEQDTINSFFDELEATDQLLLKYGWEHRAAGFLSEEPEVEAVVRALYSRCIKQDKAKEYPRRLNLTLPKGRDEENKVVETMPDFDVFMGSEDPLDVDHFDQLLASEGGYIEKGCFCRCIIQPRIWFIAGKYGLSWNLRAIELRVQPKVQYRGKYAFSRHNAPSYDAEDPVEEEEGSVEEESVEEEGSVEEEEVEDSEEEVEEEDED